MIFADRVQQSIVKVSRVALRSRPRVKRRITASRSRTPSSSTLGRVSTVVR